MKIRFNVPESTDPRRESGLSLPGQESRRVPPRLRWALILLLTVGPMALILGRVAYNWLWVESFGYVVFQETQINAPTEAQVERIAVTPGGQVHKGDTLLRLEQPELSAELAALRKQETPASPPPDTSNLRQEVSLLEHNLRGLQTRSQIMRDLAERGAATRGEVLAAENEELAASAGLSQRRQALVQQPAPQPASDPALRARLATLEARQGELELRAPADGTVDNLAVTLGQHLRSGDPLLVLRHGTPHIVAFMNDNEINFANSSKTVSIALPNRTEIKGKVLGLAPSTQRLPEELAGAFNPRTPRLQVLIAPINLPPEARIHHLPVSIRTFRFK